MFVGAICHDLDHRGFNNKFMIDIGSPLAAIYSTSTMEHHHFNMAVIILQQVCKINQLINMGKIVILEFFDLGFLHLLDIFSAY